MRLERIGEDSALIARIEAINVAAFPEIERISIKNFLKMSRKGQLEIAAIFEDFSAMGGGSADKHRAATGKNLCAPKQDFCAAKRDCGEASQNCRSAGNCATAAPNLSGEELVGFFVYRTEQTYKRVVSHHKQPPPRLNADKILRSKAHSGAEFEGAEDEIPSGKAEFSEAKFFGVASGKIASRKTQPLSGDEILNAGADSKISIDADRLICGAGGKILSSAGRDEISSSDAEGKISSGTAESKISRREKSEIPSGGESEIFYVAYLGIDAKFRGLGIGSRLLALIAEQNPRAQIVLDVEPPHEDAPNLAQRLRRIEFYGRHGFGRCGKFFNYAGLSFEILAKPPLSAPQQGFDVASFVKFIGAGNKFRFKITDAPLYKN
ncbi:hypothetical protein [uncultured Campylobacter sp.]|uniref:GNAT family N-acetyltransferase n=1 Tax=uncultured Campylobacter sp. TaxID=218934 RepID=UPI002606DAF7|nr:hypothetical protein [uncultured Campylobacter sp.]